MLKAAAVTVPLVHEVERHFPGGGPSVDFARSTIEAFVATAKLHAGGLHEFMRDAAAHLDDSLARVATIEAPVRARLDSFRARLFDRAAQAPLQSLEASLPVLMPELWETFDFAQDVAKDVLGKEGLTLPEFSRATGFDTVMSAGSRVADQSTILHNEVTLVLPQTGFSSSNLYAAPYLLTHELICHAAQGVAGPPPREGSGSNCAWSDGWMDCFAHEAACSWLDQCDIRQDWIDQARPSVVQQADQAHLARYIGTSLAKSDEANRSARIQAREAWIGLRQAAMVNGHSEVEAEAMRRAFSLRYNAINLIPEQRRDMVVGLWVKLQTDAKGAVSAIFTFVGAPDPGTLHRVFAL